MKRLWSTCLSIVCLVTLAACTNADDARKVDPNLPAVVHGPPIILPSDTARPDTMPEYRERMEAAQRELIPQYSVLGAAAVFGDRRMLASIYSPGATLRLSDSTYTGGTSVVTALADFFRRSAITDMVRQSNATNAVDSIYTDSGSYLLVSKRAGAAESLERGQYVAKWRLLPRDPRWLLLSDELTPDSPTKR